MRDSYSGSTGPSQGSGTGSIPVSRSREIMKQDQLPVWDLSAYYKSIKDPNLNKDLKKAHQMALVFVKKYKGKITKDIKPKFLHKAIQDAEAIYMIGMKPLEYSFLVNSTNTADHLIASTKQRLNKQFTDTSNELMFFELDITKLDNDILKKFINDPILLNYKNFLTKILESKPHRLTELEEKIISLKNLTGREAFQRLFEEHSSSRKYTMNRNGKEVELTQTQILDYLHDPNQENRKIAAQSFSKGLKMDSHLLTFIYNNLGEDKIISDKLTNFPTPEAYRHLSNEIDQEVVDVMSETISKNLDIVSEYYKFKKNLLKKKELMDYDRYAPISAVTKSIPFAEAQKIILEAFRSFSPTIGEIASKFFKNKWIHAKITDAKRGGAYCSGGTPDKHPSILINYKSRLDDVSTLAHELGHGINDVMMSKQTLFNYSTPLVLAETASVFAEMLLFEKLKDQVKSKPERLALYTQKIEGIFSTVFRQHAMHKFEKQFFKLRKEKGELQTKQINEIWIQVQKEMYGKSVTLTEDFGYWWSYIPHFIHTPFYVYAYAFGELLVLSLFAQYKKQGEAFVPKYIKLMEAGSTVKPQELLSDLGINLKDPKFWQEGLTYIDDMVQEVKSFA